MTIQKLNTIDGDTAEALAKLAATATPEAPSTPDTPAKRPRSHKGKLTRKQKAFADALMSDPKKTQAQAYMEAYDVKPDASKYSIQVEASRTLKKPSVISYLANYNELIENTLLSTVNDWGNSDNTRQREIAVNTAEFIHDKIHGKAKQQIQTESKVVTISINLAGDGELPPETL